jgi:hypothetical protein
MTQARPKHSTHGMRVTAYIPVPPVLDVERTVGIEIHDVNVQGKPVMVWDHGGQLEARGVMTNVLALCYGS